MKVIINKHIILIRSFGDLRFMAGAPMPAWAKPKAHPPPTNTITGNIMHNIIMDVCFKIRIKDRIHHSNSNSLSAIILWSDMRPSRRQWAPRPPRPVGRRRDRKSGPHLCESATRSAWDSVRGPKLNILPSSFFCYAQNTKKHHSRQGNDLNSSTPPYTLAWNEKSI